MTPTAGTPASSIAVCVMRGNARPMPSASTSGSPRRAAHPTGISPFAPPISDARSAMTGRPYASSTPSSTHRGSASAPIFSMPTTGAPTMPHGISSASAGRSATATRSTPPSSSSA